MTSEPPRFALAGAGGSMQLSPPNRSSRCPLPATAAPDPLADLLPRIADGDRAALRQLYQATSSKLFGVCLRILSNRDESEDVLQEVYITIWRRADRFEAGRASVMTWISTIARNRAIDRLRARGPLVYAEAVEEMEIEDEAPGAEALLEAVQSGEALGKCLSELDDRTETVIRTAFFEGVTYEALAQRMDTPLGTVKSWVRRGLLKLKGCLER
jgi:RNA polymerase sigma factor (sigma-70 family)